MSPIIIKDVTDGLLKLADEGVITDAAFSPDGTALVTTSSHGQVKFFQVTRFHCIIRYLHSLISSDK